MEKRKLLKEDSKLRVWTVCSATILVLCLSLVTGSPLESNPHCSYTNLHYGFRLFVPDSGWTFTDETGIPDVLVIMRSTAAVEGFIPNVTVAVEYLPCMKTAEEYGEKNRERLIDQGYEVHSWGRTVIHQNTFYDLQCSNRDVSPTLRFRYLCLAKNRVGIVLTCTAPNESYTYVARDFKLIVNSFRFL